MYNLQQFHHNTQQHFNNTSYSLQHSLSMPIVHVLVSPVILTITLNKVQGGTGLHHPGWKLKMSSTGTGLFPRLLLRGPVHLPLSNISFLDFLVGSSSTSSGLLVTVISGTPYTTSGTLNSTLSSFFLVPDSFKCLASGVSSLSSAPSSVSVTTDAST